MNDAELHAIVMDLIKRIESLETGRELQREAIGGLIACFGDRLEALEKLSSNYVKTPVTMAEALELNEHIYKAEHIRRNKESIYGKGGPGER